MNFTSAGFRGGLQESVKYVHIGTSMGIATLCLAKVPYHFHVELGNLQIKSDTLNQTGHLKSNGTLF